ncbi:MAG: type II toxin-antitoxin system VapC family toxin [Actinomycetota bacterium]|nr:type II toxin-antitoxin system VapC family toxin [Actinomycetota bacterium]
MKDEEPAYLDSSALVKLVVVEAESTALHQFLRRHPLRVSCALARVEVPRAVRDHGTLAISRARRLLARVHLLRLDDPILDSAADLNTVVLRSLDAVHLAAAQTLGTRLGALVTYDGRMAEAARALGLPVMSPR